MNIDREVWMRRKKAFLERLNRDMRTGYFDLELKNIITLINSFDDMYTTSSCAGRIMVFSSLRPWDKRSIRIYYKSHIPIDFKILRKIVDESIDKNLWFTMQPPIFHISCLMVKRAQELLKLARNIGFKHSGIISFGKVGIIVELRGNEHLEFPLKIEGKFIVRKNGLKKIINYANKLLIESKKKIFKLEAEIRRGWLKKYMKGDVNE